MHPSRVTALILAGGKATRFGGIAKHELVVDGETIFARQVRLLAPRVAEILVSGPAIEGHVRDVLDTSGVEYRGVRDTVEGAGPLAGIAAGLSACRTDWLLVIAGDMPHVTDELIDAMIAGSGSTSPVVETDEAGVRAQLVQLAGPRDATDEAGVRAQLVQLAGPRDAANGGAGVRPQLVQLAGGDSALDAVGVRSRGLPEPLLCLLHVRTRATIERALEAGRFKASQLLTDEGLRVHWLDADPVAVRNINSPEDLGRPPGSK